MSLVLEAGKFMNTASLDEGVVHADVVNAD
jgi:hypothetical protein